MRTSWVLAFVIGMLPCASSLADDDETKPKALYAYSHNHSKKTYSAFHALDAKSLTMDDQGVTRFDVIAYAVREPKAAPFGEHLVLITAYGYNCKTREKFVYAARGGQRKTPFQSIETTPLELSDKLEGMICRREFEAQAPWRKVEGLIANDPLLNPNGPDYLWPKDEAYPWTSIAMAEASFDAHAYQEASTYFVLNPAKNSLGPMLIASNPYESDDPAMPLAVDYFAQTEGTTLFEFPVPLITEGVIRFDCDSGKHAGSPMRDLGDKDVKLICDERRYHTVGQVIGAAKGIRQLLSHIPVGEDLDTAPAHSFWWKEKSRDLSPEEARAQMDWDLRWPGSRTWLDYAANAFTIRQARTSECKTTISGKTKDGRSVESDIDWTRMKAVIARPRLPIYFEDTARKTVLTLDPSAEEFDRKGLGAAGGALVEACASHDGTPR